jgi:tRNA-modifying protein YgfZ
MIQQLQERQVTDGATFVEGIGVPMSFGNDAAALKAVRAGVALCDRSNWGHIQVTGADRIRYLHNQTTNDFNRLLAGQGCDTVFVTSTARTIDLVSAYALEDSVLLLTSPGFDRRLIEWMDRFIFFADQVTLKNLTATTTTFSLLGPQSHLLLEKLGAIDIVGQPNASHRLFDLDGIETRVAVGSGLAIAGYTLFVEVAQAAALWEVLSADAIPLGQQVWEQLRVEQGRPLPDRELTEEVNPLEAGLWQAISLGKGCYIGQETIARLHTYRGVKQQLWGIKLSAAVASGSIVLAVDEKIGKLTSCTQADQGYLGLAYIRTKAAEEGLKVQVAGSEGELVALPFLSHEYP